MAKQTKASASPVNEQIGKERTSIYIHPDLLKKLKFICYKDDTKQTTIIENSLNDYIERWEKKNGEIKL